MRKRVRVAKNERERDKGKGQKDRQKREKEGKWKWEKKRGDRGIKRDRERLKRKNIGKINSKNKRAIGSFN